MAGQQLQSEKSVQVPTQSPFKLTLSIDSESYSKVVDVITGEKRPRLALHLKLRFTNRGNKVVRLNADCVHLSSMTIYDSPIVGPSVALLPDSGLIRHEVRGCPYVSDEKLAAISPGEVCETKLEVKFDVVAHGTFHPPESLGPGKYFLEITVGTWWEIDGQYEELKGMRKKGVNVELSVTSESIGFVVEGKPVKRRA